MSLTDDELPEGAIPLGVISVLDYVDTDGAEAYTVAVTGRVPIVKALGLLDLAKANLLEQRDG